MGEAKRRKAVGDEPRVPVEGFRVPGGKVGITIEVDGEPPSTVMFDADKIADVAAEANRMKGAPPYHQLVRGLGDEFLRARQAGEDLTAAAIGVLWTALYHPQHGAAMRTAVSRALRDQGKAHITWRLSDKGLGLALAEQFVNLDGALAVAPRDQTFAFSPQADDDQKSN